jgi:hypothetical protein
MEAARPLLVDGLPRHASVLNRLWGPIIMIIQDSTGLMIELDLIVSQVNSNTPDSTVPMIHIAGKCAERGLLSCVLRNHYPSSVS